MSKWKTYAETISEYNAEIDRTNKLLTNPDLTPDEIISLNKQLTQLIYSVAAMRPYAEREKAKAGET